MLSGVSIYMKALLQVSVFVIDNKNEWLLLFCLELRRSSILLHSDIGKHTVTHLVEGRRGQITAGLVDHCLKQARSLEDVKYFI